MNTLSDSLILNGVEQSERLLPALNEGYFNVDEMSFEDLLTASVEFASSLTYYNSSLQPSGDWQSFLASNEIVIMAGIINKNIDELRKSIELPINQNVATLSSIIFAVILEIDKWLEDLKRSDSAPAQDLVVQLKAIIRSSLLGDFHSIAATTEHLRRSNDALPAVEYKNFSEVWEIQVEGESYSFPKSNSKPADDEEAACASLRRSAFEFFNAIEHLKSICKELLPLSLKTQSHDPAISLFITFLKLYKYAQENVNTFTQRHLDYYYHEILKVRFKEKGRESATLNFSILPGSQPVEIKAGSRFVCSTDEDLRDVVFCAAENLLVNDAEIAVLHTLRFERENMITPECDLNFVTRIHRQDIPISDEPDLLGDASWPLFGDGVVDRSSQSESDAEMEVGIAIASKTLLLDEGFRKITLDVKLSRSVKPISYYMDILEQSSSRLEFREALFELMLGWLSDPRYTDWDFSAPQELVARIEKTASVLDVKDPPSMISAVTGSAVPVDSCQSLFANTIERIRNTKDQSSPYYNQLLHAESDIEFRNRLGAFLIHFLLEGGSEEKVLSGLVDGRARELRCETSLKNVKKELRMGRERLFKKYFDSAFVLNLSTETGWLEIDRYDVVDGASDGIGFQITTSLASEAVPITGCLPKIHGENWGTELPVMKLKINPEASINVYSLLERYCIDTVGVKVDVTGVRNVIAFNNISRLDPSKPFYPFGSMPTTSSYFALSAPEAVKKNVDAFRIHMHWGDLPRGEEGFDGHYAGYKTKLKNQSFSVNIGVLRNGSWQPQSASQIQNAKLFSARDKKLKDHQVIDIESVEHFRPIRADLDDDELNLGLKTRSGFVKLTLASPDIGFGHQEYPLKLSETVETNAKARAKKKKNLPNPPYTPILNKVSVDYTASSIMSMSAPSGTHQEKFSEKVFRLHPFGAEKVYPNLSGGSVPLFKSFDHDGSFLLGISASRLKGRLSLYFSLSDDSQRNKSGESIRLQWSYLKSTGWTQLQADRIISDGTKGFLCSGVLVLDIPDDARCDNADMPGSCYWLKVSSNSAFTNFCSLNRVATHAMEFVRSTDDEAIFDSRISDWKKLQWEAMPWIPGLETISQLDPFREIGKNEKRSELVTRVSERIRHRARAITSWDHERMILEKFPFVGKVLCLPNRSRFVEGTVPGNLLIIVTPVVLNPEKTVGTTPRLSAVFLNEIHEYVSKSSSVFAKIEVANPNYEWVQARCTAVFEEYAAGGMYIKQLNNDIGKYLHPWEETGYGLNFCQTIKREDIYSYIYNLDYIKYVTDFSMLHITKDGNGEFNLSDTVINELKDGKTADVIPLTPWSLIVPLKRHYIEVTKKIETITPEASGIRELEIGSTFIVGGI